MKSSMSTILTKKGKIPEALPQKHNVMMRILWHKIADNGYCSTSAAAPINRGKQSRGGGYSGFQATGMMEGLLGLKFFWVG